MESAKGEIEMSETKISGTKKRESGVELLKIIAILLIVFSHVLQTLSQKNGYIDYQDYLIDLSHSTTDPFYLTLSIMRYAGVFGNTLFFVCSAWFLTQVSAVKKDRIIHLVLDNFVISAAIALILLFAGMNLSHSLFVKSFFPTFFSMNWYVTCYVLFLFIVPFLNGILAHIDRKKHFWLMVITSFCYILLNAVYTFPYANNLMTWITIFIAVSYIKNYRMDLADNTKFNLILLFSSAIALLIILVAINYMGLKWDFFNDKIFYLNTNANPFLIVISFALFQLFRKIKGQNRFVNYLSSLSLFIYLLHENTLVKTYLRPKVWQWIYVNIGYQYLAVEIIVYTLLLFFVSAIVAALYKVSIGRLSQLCAGKIGERVQYMKTKAENRLKL